MQARRLTVVLLLLFIIGINSISAQTYTVHEWGTFTTVCGSTGKNLIGLDQEEEELPKFVYSHEGVSPHPGEGTKGIPEYITLDSVRVKMETPVLYFYSQQELDINVKVRFPNGAISQWYPQRTDGEAIESNYINFSKPFKGWISWDAKIYAPGTSVSPSPPKDQEVPTWVAPRETDANMVVSEGNIEKFLFYRGVGSFDLPLKLRYVAAKTLEVSNAGAEDISFVFVYDKRQDGKVAVWWKGKLESGKQIQLNEPTNYYSPEELEAHLPAMEDALVEAGLYRKEAAAMINTWRQSYFGTWGTKVFWVVPRSFTDEILPLDITPAPTSTERVLIGRSEIMKPELEKEIYNDLIVLGNHSKWMNNRFYKAYLARAKYLQDNPGDTVSTTASSLNSIVYSPEEKLYVYPNPFGSILNVELHQAGTQPVTLTLQDISGKNIISSIHKPADNIWRQEMDMSALTPGIYMLRVSTASGQHIERIIKQ